MKEIEDLQLILNDYKIMSMETINNDEKKVSDMKKEIFRYERVLPIAHQLSIKISKSILSNKHKY